MTVGVQDSNVELDAMHGIDEATATEKLVGLLSDDESGDESDASEPQEPTAEQAGEDGPEGEVDGSEEEEEEEEEDRSDEESEDDSEEKPPARRQTYKVKADGQEVEVTLDELLAGYSRTADYTRKTQALAEMRRSVEAELQQIRTAREDYANRLDLLARALEELAPSEPDWDELRQEDPASFAVKWAEHQRYQQQRAAVAQEQQRLQAEMLADQQRQYEVRLREEQEKLVQEIPELADPDKGRALKAKLAEYATTRLGFTPEEVAAVVDHRAVVLLQKAMRYDEIQAKAKKVKDAKPADAPAKVRPLQPGNPGAKARSMSETEKARKRLAKTGSINDAAAALMDLD